jgi:hypothetical protein
MSRRLTTRPHFGKHHGKSIRHKGSKYVKAELRKRGWTQKEDVRHETRANRERRFRAPAYASRAAERRVSAALARPSWADRRPQAKGDSSVLCYFYKTYGNCTQGSDCPHRHVGRSKPFPPGMKKKGDAQRGQNRRGTSGGGRNGGKGKRIKAKQEDGGAGASRARKSYGASSTSNGRPLPQGKRAGSVRKARGRPKGAHPPQAKAFRARLMELVDSSDYEANGDSVIAEEKPQESEERHHGSVPDTCGAVGEKDAEGSSCSGGLTTAEKEDSDAMSSDSEASDTMAAASDSDSTTSAVAAAAQCSADKAEGHRTSIKVTVVNNGTMESAALMGAGSSLNVTVHNRTAGAQEEGRARQRRARGAPPRESALRSARRRTEARARPTSAT